MDSLVGYGSDDESENMDRYGGHQRNEWKGSRQQGSHHQSQHQTHHQSHHQPRREDDTNYDDVTMDMSEGSEESEPELPQAEPAPPQRPRSRSRDERNRDAGRSRGSRDRSPDRRERRRESPRRVPDKHERDRDRREPRRRTPERYNRSEPRQESTARRGLLGDRPPALMDLKPFGSDPPPLLLSHDSRDAASPRFSERDRRDRDRDRDRNRERRDDRDRPRRRSRSRSRSRSSRDEGRSERSRSKTHYPPPTETPHVSHPAPYAGRGSPPTASGDYRPSSYKVSKKLGLMEKMGLQIKTPDGSMATAQQLKERSAAEQGGPSAGLPSYYNPQSINATRIMEQVQKRKLLWGNKAKAEETKVESTAKVWTGTKFAQDKDGKQAHKFMRLMGIKEPEVVGQAGGSADKEVDPIKKQEEMFQAMQAQYDVARVTTHTMRGVGLGFQRHL